MSLIPTYPAALYYEVAFNTAPSQDTLPALWTDITGRTQFQWNTTRGRQYELDTVPAGQWNTTLDNRDGALDPSNTASPYAPNVIPYRACRIRALLGVNQLTIDQATAGEAGGYVGPIPPQMNVVNDFGYPLTIVPFAGAYQGGYVYQAVMPSSAAAFSTILLVKAVPVVPGTQYSFEAQVQIASGNSVPTDVAILWYDNNGNSLSSVGGASATLTAGSGSWTQLSASGQAPTGACSAWLKVQPTGALSAQTTFLVDALQWEASATPTSFQVPQSVSQNLLPRAIATGSASMSAADSVAQFFSPTTGSIAQATFLAAAPSGQSVAVAWTTPSGTTSSGPLYLGVAPAGASATGPAADCVQVTPTAGYTVSGYFSRTASADTTVQVTVGIRWFDQNGNILSTSAGTAAAAPTSGWVRGTCSATAPAGAAWARARLFISFPASTTASNTIYSTGWQLEAAAAATAWADPGPMRHIYSGFVERWPQSWTMGGTYGQVSAIGVDAEALLAQDTLLDPFIEEVLTLDPNFFYTLNDPAGVSSCADAAAKRPPAPIENSPFGPGSLTLGNSISSNTTPGTFLGSAGPVATFANNPSGAPPYQYAETFINIAKTTVMPGPPAGNSWTRLLSFNAGATIPGTGNDYNLWTSYPATFASASNVSLFYFGISATGTLSIGLSNPTNHGLSYSGTANLCDGNWHQVAVVVNTSPYSTTFYLDGVVVDSVGNTQNPTPTGCFTDVLGCSINYGSNQYSQGLVGDLAHAIEIPAALTQAQITNLYQSWRNASAGDSSGGRVTRVLNWLGYIGATAIDSGNTSDMGPATDLTGATGLDALNAVALTENGNLYVSETGALTFTARGRRYNSQNPSMIFGEQAQWGEWPYESVSLDFDPTHLFNDIQVTQYSTSQVAESIDTTSESLYYQRILQRTINPALYTEAIDAANYLLQQYKSARPRVSDLTLHPSAMPGLFAACLQLEIGSRIRVMRRPPQASVITIDCFVESINWDLDPTSGDVIVHLQCSPADLAMYWTLAALHTTLNTAVTAGASSATINPLPDAPYNALASSLPSGYQLTFDPGTSIQETMTISPPLPNTGIGYTSATINFTTSFQNNHAAGAIVCEPLPTGTTNPATWDQGSVLGCAYTEFTASASSGASTITVGQLSDYKANALSSDWNMGDLLSLSPGTANWEGYNLLAPNQSTAGAGVFPLAAGTSGVTVGVMTAFGPNVQTVTTSATAWQGTSVWQLSVPANGANGNRLLRIDLPATPGQVYTASFYVRSATSGANPQLAVNIIFQSATFGSLGTTISATTTLTGSSTAAWTRVSVTATAPAGAAYMQVGIPLTATGPGSAWSFQTDGLQVEPNASPSTYQTCPQIQSVSTFVPGYSTAVITLANPLANNHAVGDYVCDPLPAGTTNPTMFPATSRIAY